MALERVARRPRQGNRGPVPAMPAVGAGWEHLQEASGRKFRWSIPATGGSAGQAATDQGYLHLAGLTSGSSW